MTDQQRLETGSDPMSPTQVRQGVVSFRVISILIVSTCLALVVMGVVWLSYGHHAHHGIGQVNPAPTRASS